MRLGLILIALFVGGALVGWLAAASQAADEESQIITVTDTAKVLELEAKIERLESYRNQLASTNREMTVQLSALLQNQAALEAAVLQAELPPESLELYDEPVSEPSPDQSEARERRRRQAEQWRERFAGQARDMFDRQFAMVDDPAALESLAALNEWRQYQQSLRQELRGVESEEDRNAILADMQEARRNSQQLVNQQQDSLLRTFAEKNGISGETEQGAFADQLREVLQNPFFQMERMLVGGGGSMGGGWPMGRRGSGQRSFGRPPAN